MVASLQQLAAIDAQYQQQQAGNAAAVAALVLLYWRGVDPENLAGTGASFISQSIAAILGGREKSITAARSYVETIRKLQLPNAPAIKAPILAPVPEEQLRRSLSYTGLGAAAVRVARSGSSRQTPSAPPSDPDLIQQFLDDTESAERQEAGRQQLIVRAMDQSGAGAAAAAVRHVQNGGRDYAKEFFGLDKYARGFVRVTRPGCCWFCALLASRGAVYGKDAFSKSDAKFEGMATDKVHDSCQCAMRIVYTQDAEEIPDLAREADAIYRSVAEGSSAQRRNAFRRAWNTRAVA